MSRLSTSLREVDAAFTPRHPKVSTMTISLCLALRMMYQRDKLGIRSGVLDSWRVSSCMRIVGITGWWLMKSIYPVSHPVSEQVRATAQ
jgi:hypothetical protein